MGFSEFIRERQFLSNVSPSALEWYKHSFKWLDTKSPSQGDLKAAVVHMREKGLKATACKDPDCTMAPRHTTIAVCACLALYPKLPCTMPQAASSDMG
jgi:hypothetical protein